MTFLNTTDDYFLTICGKNYGNKRQCPFFYENQYSSTNEYFHFPARGSGPGLNCTVAENFCLDVSFLHKDKALTAVVGCKERGRQVDGPLDHSTGKGWVKDHEVSLSKTMRMETDGSRRMQAGSGRGRSTTTRSG